jgi:hypothetical protein
MVVPDSLEAVLNDTSLKKATETPPRDRHIRLSESNFLT